MAPMSRKTLHLIEPTLFDQTGHGLSYVHSLIIANQEVGFSINVWLDRRGENLLDTHLCKPNMYFFRPLRQLQKLFLYFKLIKRPDIILIGTSELWDLKILICYVKLFNSKAKIFMHFHQFKQTATKIAALKKMAAAAENITILTPTEQLAQIFSINGFKDYKTIPCPVLEPPKQTLENSTKFSKVLYAGAARNDKGFTHIVKLLQYMQENNIKIPFEIQVSKPNSLRYDTETEQALQVLQTLNKNNLVLHTATLTQNQYSALFNNAICLLLYDKSYKDKFSGVALDAFYAGCPIVTIANTWIGDTVTKYTAGIVLDNYDILNIHAAIETIIKNYSFYQANAQQAAKILSIEHDPKNTLLYIKEKSNGSVANF